MGIFARLVGAGQEQRSASPYVAAFLRGDDLPNSWGQGGRVVTETSALSVTAVFACVQVIAETLASLPLITYRQLQPRGRERATSHPLYGLLHDRPNPEMSAMPFREALLGHVCLWGTGYAEIQRDADDRPIALWPLRPDRMSAARTSSGQLYWQYRMPDGTDKPFDDRNLLRITGIGSNGIRGYSRIQLADEAIGLALDAQSFGARFFQNDSRPGGVLQSKDRLSDEAFEHLKQSWEEAHRGVGNAWRVAILEEGVTWQQVGLPPGDAQWIETRKLSVVEIARLYRVPLHLIQHLEQATFTNIEHQSLDFVIHTVRPWAQRFEEACERVLLSDVERQTLYVEHLVDGLLRGDLKTRYEAYSIGSQNGFLSANDVREIENLNPIPAEEGGDVYRVQLNMTSLKSLLVETPEQAASAQGAQNGRALPTDLPEDGFPAETRARWPVGSAQSRLRIAGRYERLLRDAANRIVRREASEVRAACKRYLTSRDLGEFRSWLRRYYGDFGAYVARTMTPSMLAFGEAIEEDAAAELGEDAAFSAVEAWLHAYATTFGQDYAARSRGQLDALLDQAIADETDPAEAVDTRVGEWENSRPRKVSHNELTRLAGALVIAAWSKRGVKRIQWVGLGGKECAFCRKLDGKIVGIEHDFVSQGDDVEGDEQTGSFRADRPYRHPPIHGFCKCGLRAIRGED